MDRSWKHKIKMETVDFSTIDQIDLIDIYKIFQSTLGEYSFSQAHMEDSSG